MFRVDHTSATASMPAPSPANNPGYFTEGNEAGGVPATVVTADWANMVQEELINVVQAGGLTPAKSDFNQLLLAIQALIQQGQASAVAKVEFFAVKTPPVGYLKCNGLTIGKPGSGATARANEDVFSLYEALWQDWSNSILTIQTASGAATVRGSSAQADWDALKRLPLPEIRGEGIRAWDDGRGVDSGRVFGSAQAGQNESHTHAASSGGAGAHGHSGSATTAGSHSHTASSAGAGAHGHSAWSDTQGTHSHTVAEGSAAPSGGAYLTSGDDYTAAVAFNQTTSASGAHAHNVGIGAVGDHSHGITVAAGGGHGHSLSIDAVGDHSHGITVAATGGGETRMRNVALSAFIRYL
ncbi:MAG: hypothetical protein NDI93_01825 [Pseudomonas sp.]|nr:hypothetical protein [Pseudomonas sp.]